MKVLMITGDKRFVMSPRFALQSGAVEKLAVVYWGRGALWPRLPNERFDVVSVQDPFWRGLFAWTAARRLRARFNVQVHTDLSAHSLVRHVLAQIILRHADSVRTVSEKIKAQVEAIGVRAPVRVLPLYVDLARFQQITKEAHEELTILWLGRFEDEKNPSLALTVLKEVRDTGIQARLVMLGEGSQEKQLKKMTQGLPVEFPGWQDPLPYLAKADAVLSTSRHESWGASIIEALAAGVPVVAPDIGIAREAGAIVVPTPQLAQTLAEVLRTRARGELKLILPTETIWAQQWSETLI